MNGVIEIGMRAENNTEHYLFICCFDLSGFQFSIIKIPIIELPLVKHKTQIKSDPMADIPASKPTIFISYAHADEELKKELDKHLKMLKRSGKVETWNDRELIAGQEWDDIIMSELNKANIILLLISIDFNASDFIWDKELASAMKRHDEGTAYVVPVILRRCEWHNLPYAKLQSLPRNSKPITEYENRDEAFTEIAVGIEKLVDYIRSR